MGKEDTTISDAKPVEASSTPANEKAESLPAKNTGLADLVKSVLDEKLGKPTSEEEGSSEVEQDQAKGQDEEASQSDKGSEADSDKVSSDADESEQDADDEEPKTEEVDEKSKAEDREKPEQPDPDSKLPFHKHPRFQELVKQGNELKSVKAQAEQDKPFVESAKALSAFCAEHKIADSDLREALTIVALGKTDPKAFRGKLQEILSDLEIASGDRLPVDLQKKVEDNLIDEESAKEIARLRLQTKQAESTGKTYEQQLLEQRRVSITTAINSWEQVQQKSPDYPKLRNTVAKFFTAACAANYPQTPAEAVSLLEQSLKEAKDTVASFLPKPKARKPVQLNGSTTSATEAEEDFESFDNKSVLKFVKSKMAARH